MMSDGAGACCDKAIGHPAMDRTIAKREMGLVILSGNSPILTVAREASRR